MLRYQGVALALKAFSANRFTRSAYRNLANRLRSEEGASSIDAHIDYGAHLIAAFRTQGLLDGRPIRGFELGTGWMHVYGLITWLVCPNAKIDLYDVWDNRQFGRMKNAFAAIGQKLDRLRLTQDERERAAARIPTILSASSFSELYAAIGSRHFVYGKGDLASFGLDRDAYDVIFSVDVLEHVPRALVSSTLQAMWHGLKPGGAAIHQIGLNDHLWPYDRDGVSRKQFLAYSEREWALRFENGVQYINLVSYDEFRRLFAASGFEEVSTELVRRPEEIAKIRVHERFRAQSQESLECTRARAIYRRPIA
jgi:hypothetical protein